MGRALIVYTTRTQETLQIANLIAEGIRFSGQEAVVCDVKEIKKAEDLEGYDAYLFGSPTYHGEMLQPLKTFLFLAEKADLANKTGGAFGAHGWSTEAQERIFEVFVQADGSIATTVAVNFTPEWYQVFPSVDLKMPLSVNYGLGSDAPIILGGTKDVGNFAIGLAFIYQQELQVDIKYSQALGSDAPSRDRDFVSVTAKYTF